MGAPSPRKKASQKKKPGPKRMSAQVVTDEDYQLRFEKVAGIDIAKPDGMVCLRLPPEKGKKKRTSKVWTVTASVPDIEELARDLLDAGVEKVSMESTSDYWRSWYFVLEAAGVEVQLVNSSQAKNLPGRPKTDKHDAQWIARLTEMGLLRPSFVPPPEIRALRQHTRLLARLTQDRVKYWQRLEKVLEDALCKVSSVASKVAGSVSVRAMLEAMIAGERDPQALADLAQGRMQAKRPELVKAFTRMRFGDEHAFAAASHLRMADMLEQEIARTKEQVTACLAAIPAAWGIDADGTTGPAAGLGEDAAVLPAVERLAEIDGMGWASAVQLIAEIGLDMSIFPTPEALVSWAGMAPVAAQSGSRNGRAKKGGGNRYARRVLGGAGNGAALTHSFLGERHRRIRSRPGSGWNKASCAVGRSILVIVWHLLKDPSKRYEDLGPDFYARHASTGRKIRGHIRQLEALGLDVTVTLRQEEAA